MNPADCGSSGETVTRTTQLIVSSRMRRLDLYPNTFSYAVNLPERIKNVVSCALIQAIIPNSQTTVNQFNNKLQLVKLLTAELVTITVPTGDYEPALLLNELKTLLAQYVANPVVTLDTSNNRVTIAADEPISLLFSSGDQAFGSVHRALGFPSLDTPFDVTFTGSFALNLPPPNYVTVAVDEVPAVCCKRFMTARYEQGGGGYDSRVEQYQRYVLDIVPLNCEFGTNKYYHAAVGDLMNNTFKPIDLSSLTINLFDDQGNPYDSNGFDHTLVLQLTTCEANFLPLLVPGNDRIPVMSAPACGSLLIPSNRRLQDTDFYNRWPDSVN